MDSDATFDHVDAISQQALDIVLSGRTREAFDLSKEDAKTRDWYGPGWGEQALLARRLIEAGVRFVSLNTGYWDDHGNIKGALDDKLPRHDRAVGVLIQDLADRGLLEDTLVVSAGEFGRTPKINNNAGRLAVDSASGGCSVWRARVVDSEQVVQVLRVHHTGARP